MTDVLNARRNISDICWILKDYESKISYFNSYKSKEIIRKLLLDSLDFKYDINLLSDKMGKSKEELLKDAETILSNMTHNIGMNSIRFMGVTLSKIMKRIYTHVRVNVDGIAKMKESLKLNNVILMPTHRSYADFLLVSYVMFTFNLPMPVIAAAMDFMNMKFVGELLRCCGAFFIRRSFVDDELYWSVFSHYIKTLVKISQESLEFFIEGTRSRTNKSLFPKIGMLGIILEMWLSGNSDIKIIPIGISYDRILEEKLYAWELFGVPKPKESTSGLFKVRHILSENYGNVYFNVGDAISLSELANQFGVKRIDHNLQLRFRPTLFDSEKSFLRQLSKIIVENQQKNLIISDWSVLVLILLNYGLRHTVKSIPMVGLVKLYKEMISLLFSFGVNLAASVSELTDDTALQNINDSLAVHSGLVHRDQHGSITLIADQNMFPLTPATTNLNTVIVERIHLGIYRNPLLFHLTKESLLLNRIRFGRSVDYQAIFEDFKVVFDLFSREFIFAGSAQHNYDASLTKLRQSLILINDWTINESNHCVEQIEDVIRLYVLAYIIYGHVFITELVPRATSVVRSTVDQVKRLQQVAIEVCCTPGWRGLQYLEMCSLDMARNALAQMMEINKRESLDVVKSTLNALSRFIDDDTGLSINMALNNLTTVDKVT